MPGALSTTNLLACVVPCFGSNIGISWNLFASGHVSILEFCTHLLGFELQWLYLSGRFQGMVSGCSKALNSAIIWVSEAHPLTFKCCSHSRCLKQNSIFFNLQIWSDWLSYPEVFPQKQQGWWRLWCWQNSSCICRLLEWESWHFTHHHRHTEWWCKFLYLMSLQYYVQVDGIWGPSSLVMVQAHGELMLGFTGWKGVKLRWNSPWFFICKTRAAKWHPEEGRRRGLQAGRCRCWVFMQLNFSKHASLCKAYGWLTEASWNEMLWFSFGLSVGYRIVNLRWPLAYFCLIWTYFISWHISTYFTSLQNFVGYDRYGEGEGYAKKEADRLSWLLSGVSCNLLWDVSSMQLRWLPQETSTTGSWSIVCSLCPDCQPKQSGRVHSEEEYFVVHSG